MMTETSAVRSRSLRRKPLAASRYISGARSARHAARFPLAPPHARRRAFTLLEVIIVIGIIVLLTALTVTVAVGVNRRSEIRETENTLKLLDLAMGEWMEEADRQLTWGVDGEPSWINPSPTYDLHPDTPQEPGRGNSETMLNIVLDRLNRNPASQSILRQIDPKFLKRIENENDPSIVRLEVRDAWENPIYVIHPGRVADPRAFNGTGGNFDGVGVFKDEDGTIRVSASSLSGAKSHAAVAGFDQSWEGRLGVCKNRRVCFVSAGPDGDFGSLSEDPNDTESDYEAAADNVYSYPVDKP